MLQATYTMDRSVPSTFTNGEYSIYVLNEWNNLLNSPGVDEKKMQVFLETHPCMLPFSEIPLNHGSKNPLSSAVVTQPLLPGLKSKVPDFMYFTGNSGEITAVLVEIESPEKKWFTQAVQPSAELTQASTQITSWRTWFNDPLNVLAFERDYLVREYGPLNNRTFKQKYILVIGRRNDITESAAQQMRSLLQRGDESWMTYDRLQWSAHWDDAVTVRLDRSGPSPQFRAIHVPPMFRLGPHHYPNYHKLAGLDDAINCNNLISAERKEFLINRLSYWRGWYTKNNGIIVINGGDIRGE